MKQHINILSLAFLLAITLMAGKCNKDTTPPEDQLPPVTQTGANTFGCLVNGKVFIPKGYDGNGTPNPNKIFDIGLNGLPYFQIIAKQLNKTSNSEGAIVVSIGDIHGQGSYSYPKINLSIGWDKYLKNCQTISFDSTIYRSGGGVITRYDLTNGIISGTFNFKYKTISCDTVFITDGRFDFKL